MKTESLRGLLRKSGYKATTPRLAILTLFTNAKNPLSAQEIIQSLPSDFDQATIYRTLKTFKTKGLIKQIDLRHNHAHYELASLHEHHHLVCVRCGRIEDVGQCGLEEVEVKVLRVSKHFSEIKQHALEFYGICNACAKKSAKIEVPINKNAPL